MTVQTFDRAPRARQYQRNLTVRSTQYAKEELAPALARCIVESMRGMRPINFLQTKTTPEVFQLINRRHLLSRRIHGKLRPAAHLIQITSVHCCEVNDRVIEVSATVNEPIRVRCMAFRLELKRSGWKIAALEIG